MCSWTGEKQKTIPPKLPALLPLPLLPVGLKEGCTGSWACSTGGDSNAADNRFGIKELCHLALKNLLIFQSREEIKSDQLDNGPTAHHWGEWCMSRDWIFFLSDDSTV